MDDDYYSLLGVDADAPTSDIRAAYRDKKAALEAKNDKTAVAALNKAWNVLSDPYQRGRYDAQLEQGTEVDEVEVVPVAGDPPPRRGLFGGPPRERPPMPQPTIEPPPGTRFPVPRRRVTAMVIDLAVLLLFFVIGQFAIIAAIDANYETETDRIDEINDDIDALNDDIDALEDDDAPQAEIDELEQEIDVLEDERGELADEYAPLANALNGATYALSLLYLAVPSAITGRTLGKGLQGLKVVRQDGRKLGWGGAFYRYGLIVVAAFALSPLLGPLSSAIILFVVLRWMNNPNQQGLHDRLSRTLVVADATEDRHG